MWAWDLGSIRYVIWDLRSIRYVIWDLGSILYCNLGSSLLHLTAQP